MLGMVAPIYSPGTSEAGVGGVKCKANNGVHDEILSNNKQTKTKQSE